MILTTHIIAATAATKYIGTNNLFFSFLIGIVSHFVLDAIPHWDYELKSLKKNKAIKRWNFLSNNFSIDVLKVALDILFGILLGWYFVLHGQKLSPSFIAATLGGIFPDFLQAIFFTGKFQFLKPLQTFHKNIHWSKFHKLKPLLGIITQILIIIILIYFIT